MPEVDNQRALTHILEDELTCLRVDVSIAEKRGKHEIAALLRTQVQELCNTVEALIEGENDV